MPVPPHSIASILVSLGESDCERIGSGDLVQPLNAVTSLAFSVVGIALTGWAAGARGRERWVRWAFVTAMVATGIGSFLYHGPQPPGSGFFHDVTFLTALLVLVTSDAAAARSWTDRTLVATLGASVVAVSLLLVTVPTITNVLTGITVVLIVITDVLLFGRSGRATPWYLAAIGLLMVALVANVLGRTGSPLCDPDSPVQLHAAWHVLSAGALGCYAIATGAVRASLGRPARETAER